MKKSIIISVIILTTIMNAQTKLNYPKTKKGTQVDTYFGTTIQDPYRWLENDKSPETEAWVKSENEVTYDYLSKIPYRDALKARMTQLWNYEKITAPFNEGSFTYFYKNNGLQNQSVLYRKDEKGVETIFLDPNTFSKDGTTSLDNVSFSKDGSLVAYSVSEAGSDWRKVIFLNAITNTKIADGLVDVKFSGLSWKGNEGIYYSSYEKPKGSELSAKTDEHKLYFHTLGTDQKTDKVIFGNQEKRRYVGGYLSEDENYLFISASNSTSGNELYFKDLRNPTSEIQTMVTGFETDNDVIEANNDTFLILTNFNAPNKKVVSVKSTNASQKNWVDFIPETENVLTISSGGNNLFAEYMKDAVSVIKQFDLSGKMIREVKLPGLGTISGFSGKKEEKNVYYTFTNYTTAGAIYNFDIASGKSKLYLKPKVAFNGDAFESKQVFYPSKDGTKIPMIITYKKGIKLNGKNPTILYGYGGFNISLTPAFSIGNAIWLENGGVYAVANLRGGGEYGKKWHDAGIKTKKQNVFDDFIAAAEFLIKQNYTSSNYLAIKGGSNGGLLVGAVMTQRPDLMKVALPAVGVMDMLRYHTFTAGAGWNYDYGTAEDSKEMFDYLKNYSPVNNVKEGTKYPATIVTTGDHDDRVVPAHSFKFAANLQEKQAGENPVLIRIDVKSGHGAGKSVAATIQETADVQAFTLFNMGILELPKL